jgi:hypothetical protein
MFTFRPNLDFGRYLLIFSALSALSPLQLPAERSIFAYAGNAVSTSGSLDLENVNTGSKTEIKLDDGEAVMIGLGIGRWRKMENIPADVGVAMELWNLQYESAGSQVDIKSTGISFLFMLRTPLLKNDQFPHGRLIPHIAMGPSFSGTRIKTSFHFPDESAADDRSWGLGFDLSAGATWQASQKMGFVAEFRQKYLNLESSEDNYRIFYEDYDKINGSLTTRYILLGIAISL